MLLSNSSWTFILKEPKLLFGSQTLYLFALFVYIHLFCCIFILPPCPHWGCQLQLTLLEGSPQRKPCLGLCVCVQLCNVRELGAAKTRQIEPAAASSRDYLSIHMCDQYHTCICHHLPYTTSLEKNCADI